MRNTKTLIEQLTTTTSPLKGLLVFAMVWLLAVAPETALAQGKARPKPTVNVKAQTQEEDPGKQPAEDRGGAHDGIKVHGHWVIEVHNPDGSFVSRTEFENSLVTAGGGLNGTDVLSTVLARQGSAGFWRIRLVNPGGTPPCLANGTAQDCFILEPNDPFSSPGVFFKNLAVGLVNTATTQGQLLVLSGTATISATQNTFIGRVGTETVLCQGVFNGTTGSCSGLALQAFFTVRDLGQPVAVASGQIVQVTVTINFS